MVQKKHKEIGKSLIENNTITAFTDLLKYLPKVAIAEGMAIHYNSLNARMENIGSITLDSLLNLGECFEVDPLTIVTLAAKERIQQRKKKTKK